MKRIWILATLLILTACTAAVESPTPSPSLTATPTVTLTPSPNDPPTAVPTLPACPGGALLYDTYDGDEVLWRVYWVCPEDSVKQSIATRTRAPKSISPTGDQVAFDGETLQVMNLNSREITTLFEAVPDEEIVSPSWSPDGEYIIYRRRRSDPEDSSIEAIHLPTSTVSEVFIPDEYKEQLSYAAVDSVEWLPQGDQILLYGSYTLDIYILDITCDDSSHLCAADNLSEIPSSRSIRSPVVSPDGKLIAAICTIPDTHPVESSLCILDFNGSVINEYHFADIGIDYAYNLAWSPDGSRIAFDDGVRIYIFSLTEQSPTRFIRGSQPIWLP